MTTLSLHNLSLDSRLDVVDYLCPVHLGCTAEERREAQEVLFGLSVQFAKLPEGCQSDQLEDTLCYAEICSLIREVASSREYQLVESLAYEVLQSLKSKLPKGSQFELKVHKVRPPVDHLKGGVHFVLSGQLT